MSSDKDSFIKVLPDKTNVYTPIKEGLWRVQISFPMFFIMFHGSRKKEWRASKETRRQQLTFCKNEHRSIGNGIGGINEIIFTLHRAEVTCLHYKKRKLDQSSVTDFSFVITRARCVQGNDL